MYKFEIHLHTSACSGCSRSTGKQMVDAAIEKGYSGLVVTNHFYHGNTCIDRNLPWEEFVGAYIEDYENVKAYGEKKGITVFFGIEEGFAPGKEMLIYRLEPRCLVEHPEFAKMTAKEKTDFVRKNGGICVCAHPFRDRTYIPDPETPPQPDLFDGIEGFNFWNKVEENEKAFVFALNNKKIITSGGDIHRHQDLGEAGIGFDAPVNDYATFISRLKSGDFKLIYPDNRICGD